MSGGGWDAARRSSSSVGIFYYISICRSTLYSAAELEATKKELAETQAKLEAAEAAAAAAPAEGEEAPAE